MSERKGLTTSCQKRSFSVRRVFLVRHFSASRSTAVANWSLTITSTVGTHAGTSVRCITNWAVDAANEGKNRYILDRCMYGKGPVPASPVIGLFDLISDHNPNPIFDGFFCSLHYMHSTFRLWKTNYNFPS